jgi:hypothetical protein
MEGQDRRGFKYNEHKTRQEIFIDRREVRKILLGATVCNGLQQVRSGGTSWTYSRKEKATITVDKLKRRASSCRILYELFQTFTQMIYLTECTMLQCVNWRTECYKRRDVFKKRKLRRPQTEIPWAVEMVTLEDFLLTALPSPLAYVKVSKALFANVRCH